MSKSLRIRKRKNLNLFLYREYQDGVGLYEESKATADTLSKKFKIPKENFEFLKDGESYHFEWKNKKYVLPVYGKVKELETEPVKKSKFVSSKDFNKNKQIVASPKKMTEEANSVIQLVIDMVRVAFLDANSLDDFDEYIQNNANAPRLYPVNKKLNDKQFMLQYIAEHSFLIIRDNYDAAPTVHDFYEWLFKNIHIEVSF